jgi:uncharacterized protein (DUF1015 family)
MAMIYPFRGYRFNPQVIGELSQVVTQPYDKISPTLQQEYYDRSPYNVVRITLNLEKKKDPNTHYSDAGATWRRWLAEGVLIQDPQPAIYAYRQEYEIEREMKQQRGFIALLDLKHSGASILPHERTMSEPKMDRLRLMRQVECNDDSIFMLYTEDRLAVNRILTEKTASQAPDLDATDDFGVKHRVWAVTDPKTLRKIQDAMVPEELFIADGHHRFETALNFMKEGEERGWRALGTESFNKRMATCFNSADQGITILPTHRLIRNLPEFDSPTFLNNATHYFELEEVASESDLWTRMRKTEEGHVFGFYPADTRRFHLLTLREEAKIDPLMLAHGETYRHLDVSILHTLLLDKILGIGEAKLVAQANVDYARERDFCVRSVQEGKHQAAFFLNPTTVEQMQRVALLGERMPQKSTDFYPKLLTGLVFMKMQIAKF